MSRSPALAFPYVILYKFSYLPQTPSFIDHSSYPRSILIFAWCFSLNSHCISIFYTAYESSWILFRILFLDMVLIFFFLPTSVQVKSDKSTELFWKTTTASTEISSSITQFFAQYVIYGFLPIIMKMFKKEFIIVSPSPRYKAFGEDISSVLFHFLILHSMCVFMLSTEHPNTLATDKDHSETRITIVGQGKFFKYLVIPGSRCIALIIQTSNDYSVESYSLTCHH
jgi:hypothetical protein